MKIIRPLLCLLFLASCSQPPPRGFQPYGSAPAPRPAAAPIAPRQSPSEPNPKAPVPEAPSVPLTVTNSVETNRSPAVVKESPPAPRPAMTNTPAARALTPAIAPAGAGQPSDEVIPAGTINFPATDLNQVLQIYSELVNRTVLRPANLGAPLITLKTQTPLTKKEAIAAFDAVLAMNGITMIDVGDKFVKVVPTAQAPTAAQAPDTRSAGELAELGPYVTHVIQLKYTKPSEIVPALQPFAQSPNSILPIDSSGILVLRDFTENVKRMLEMIDRIDLEVPSEFISEVIPIKYAKASEISDALNSLSGGGGGASVGRGAGAGAGGGAGRGTSRTGAGFNRSGVGAAGGTTAYGAQASPGGTMPGQQAAPGGGTSFTERLRSIIKSASGSADLQIIGQTKIISDERSNSLLIFATRQDMEMIKSIISKLDVVLAQVLIETAIMDVQLSNSRQLGVSGVQTPKQFSSNPNVAGGGGYNNGQSFFDQFLNNINSTATNASAFLGAIPGGGFSYWAQLGQNYNVALEAAANDERINVIQKPQILTTHATPGSIFIGSTVPYITSTYYNSGYGGGPSSSYQQLQVGIGLQVTPYINSDGLVVMQIDEDISELAGSTSITGVGNVPNTTSRKFSAEVAVRDGDTVMLGGFIRNASDKVSSGIPLLKDIPLLGFLFSNQSKTKSRDELVVLMRPTVLKTPAIAAAETAKWKKGLPGVSGAEQEVRAEEKEELKREQKNTFDHSAPVTPDEQKLYGLPPSSTPQP